ncbi:MULTISPECIES: DUF3397 domain-containing protein [Gracilibacillus]|uniref:DUF3397 domain-containing protein n=1 Tax=Gracilibacillus TaxID=74385 RepID=UPI00082609B5|nr:MULTISPECIES: DUF3397 domain-containing protein [Gracilibacillus]
MLQGLYYLFALMVTIPVLVTYIVYLITFRITRKNRYSFHVAVDWTTLLYIFSVIAMGEWFFSINLFGYIITFLLLLLLIMVIYHWRFYTDIVFTHVWKRFWKLAFLIFFMMYLGGSVAGIIYSIGTFFTIVQIG